MKRSREWLGVLLTLTAGLTTLFLLGCEIDSADSVVRNVEINYAGFYVGDDGSLVSQQTGAKTTSLNLRQTGDQLEAVDNNGIVFRGTLGSIVDETATFVLDGSTTAGQSVTIDGTLTASGTEGTMRGTWIEPALYGTVSGKAVINPVQTNNNDNTTTTNLTISPTSATLNSNGNTATFAASGGTSPYSWTVGNSSLGALTADSGSSVTYQRVAAGNNTITVRDAEDDTATANITQP